MSGAVKLITVVLPFLAVSIFLLHKLQDADLTVHFYENLGERPSDVLRDRVVWITGASSGIGEYLAYEVCKFGAKVVLSARREDQLQRVKEKCAEIALKNDKKYNIDNLMVLPLDVRKFKSHKELTKTVLNRFKKIDVLVNNAGRSQRGWAKDMPLDVEQELLDLNTVGTISLTKAVLPSMLKANVGQIVVVSSVMGKFGFPYEATYCASKFALHGYFNSLRMELSETNINVQMVCPGPVKSNVAANAFTSTKNKSFKDLPTFTDNNADLRMPTERCAYLMAVAMANNLDEVWISPHPALGLTYMSQYMPTTFNWFSQRNFLKFMKKMYFKE